MHFDEEGIFRIGSTGPAQIERLMIAADSLHLVGVNTNARLEARYIDDQDGDEVFNLMTREGTLKLKGNSSLATNKAPLNISNVVATLDQPVTNNVGRAEYLATVSLESADPTAANFVLTNATSGIFDKYKREGFETGGEITLRVPSSTNDVVILRYLGSGCISTNITQFKRIIGF